MPAPLLRRLALVASCLVAFAGLVAGLAGCAAPVATAAQPPARGAVATVPPHLVVYGDSLSVAVNEERHVAAWPLRVARALGDPQPSVYGMPGFTAGEIDAALADGGIRTGAASVLIVEAGTNDFWHLTPVAQFQADYPALLDDARSTATGRPSGAPRLFCLGVWTDEGHTNDLGATVAQYDAIIRAACAARGGTYRDLSGLFGDPANISLTDHFHPSAAGQAAIARLVAQALTAA